MTELEERLLKIVTAVAGCTNCSACREVALKVVGNQWHKGAED